MLYDVTFTDLIKNARALWEDYDKKVDEVMFIRDTLQEKFVSLIKQAYGFSDFPLLIRNYLNDKSKDNARTLKRRLNFKFGKQNWKLDEILMCGNDVYAYQIPFVLNRKKYILQLPVHPHLSIKNIRYAMNGEYALYIRDSKYSITFLYSDYTMEKMNEYIKGLADD